MTSFTVLHASDLHWSPEASQDLGIVINAMLADLTRLKEESGISPDIIVFSGDLAKGGDELSWLQGGYDHFIIPLSRHTGVPIDRIFVCPGNHDISRNIVRKIPSIETSLKTALISTRAINAYIDKPRDGGDEKDLSLRRMDNFYYAHDCYHPQAISSTDFLRTYKIIVNDRSIGIACFNSAWRASGEPNDVDYQRLIIGERAIDQALVDLEGCDFRIAVHHHPLEWLVAADRQTTDFLTRRSFNLSCCGHTHTARPAMLRDAAGSCITSQTGSVFDKREWFNGYQIIEIDIPSQAYTFTIREYINDQRRFDAANTVCDGGRITLTDVVQGDPRRVDQVELFSRAYRDHLRDAVVEQLNTIGSENSSNRYDVMSFVTPPIVERNRSSLEQEDKSDEKANKIYKVPELLGMEHNLIILGESQSGKTSIAYFMAYQLAFEQRDASVVPLYIDLRIYKMNRYGIKRALMNFYGPPPAGFNVDRAIDNGLFVFIVDNVPASGNIIDDLVAHCNEFNKNRWILFGTPDKDGVSPDRVFNERLSGFSKFHIRELTRGGIRAISKNRWRNDSSESKAAYEMVMAQLVRDGLPRTPYMVSLLLWAVQEKRDLVKINEAILLSNIMDHLLGKADFRLTKLGILNPLGKEITLQNLANYLHDNGGVVTENEATTFLIDFFRRKRLAYVGGDVLEKLVVCGILKRDGDTIAFKHSCFQEFFLALLLKNDRKLLEHYLTGLNFLKVRREMELLAGIRQQNDDIINAISSLLDERAPTRFLESHASAFDQIAAGQLKIGTTRAQLGKIRRTRLSDEQVDEMMDEADRRAMARGERPLTESLDRADGNVVTAAKEREAEGIEADRADQAKPMRPSTHMAAIDTLARVIRNSDFTDYDQKGPATKRVLESWVKIFIIIMDDVNSILKTVGKKSGDPLTEEEFERVVYLVSKFFFNNVAAGVVGHLSSPSMTATLESLIEEGELTTGEHLIVLFLLEDADDHNWQGKWAEIVRDKQQSGFVIDCFVGRLLMIAHTKAIDDDQAKRIGTVISEIEQRLAWSNATKTNVFEDIKEAVALTTIRQAHA